MSTAADLEQTGYYSLHLPVLDNGVKEWGEKWWTADVGAGSLQEEVEHALQVVVGGC